jgi:hypothetical protein
VKNQKPNLAFLLLLFAIGLAIGVAIGMRQARAWYRQGQKDAFTYTATNGMSGSMDVLLLQKGLELKWVHVEGD